MYINYYNLYYPNINSLQQIQHDCKGGVIMNNDSNTKQNFIDEITKYTKEDIEELISSKGKPRKLIRPAFIVRK